MSDRPILSAGIFSGSMFRFCGIFFVALLPLVGCTDNTKYYNQVKDIKAGLVERDKEVLGLLDSIRTRVELTADTARYDSIMEFIDWVEFELTEDDVVLTGLEELENELILE